MGVEVRTAARTGVDRGGLLDRRRQVLLRDVSVRVEDSDERRLLPGAERLHRLLVGLIGGVARNRERLEPALGHATRREDAEGGEENPASDDDLAMSVNRVSQPREHA